MPPVPKLPGSGIPVATGDESLYKDSCRAPSRLHQYNVTTRTWADSVGPGMFEAGGQVFGEGGVIERAPIEPGSCRRQARGPSPGRPGPPAPRRAHRVRTLRLVVISKIIISNRRAATTCQRLWTSSRGRGASPATSWSGSRSRSARQCGLVGPLPRVRRRPPQRPSAPTITGVAGSAQPMPVISCLQPARSPSARTFRRRLTRMKKWAHQVNEHEETLEGYCGAR